MTSGFLSLIILDANLITLALGLVRDIWEANFGRLVLPNYPKDDVMRPFKALSNVGTVRVLVKWYFI